MRERLSGQPTFFVRAPLYPSIPLPIFVLFYPTRVRPTPFDTLLWSTTGRKLLQIPFKTNDSHRHMLGEWGPPYMPRLIHSPQDATVVQHPIVPTLLVIRTSWCRRGAGSNAWCVVYCVWYGAVRACLCSVRHHPAAQHPNYSIIRHYNLYRIRNIARIPYPTLFLKLFFQKHDTTETASCCCCAQPTAPYYAQYTTHHAQHPTPPHTTPRHRHHTHTPQVGSNNNKTKQHVPARTCQRSLLCTAATQPANLPRTTLTHCVHEYTQCGCCSFVHVRGRLW